MKVNGDFCEVSALEILMFPLNKQLFSLSENDTILFSSVSPLPFMIMLSLLDHLNGCGSNCCVGIITQESMNKTQ